LPINADIHVSARKHSSPFSLHSFIFLSLIALAVIAGCTPRPKVELEPGKALSQEEWIAILENRTHAWQAYQTQLHIRAESQKGKFSFRAVLMASLPDRFRLEAFNPFGQTVSLLILDGEQQKFRLYVPSEKAVYTAARAETLIAHFLGVPIPLETLGYSLVACVPPEHLYNLSVTRHDGGWIGRSEGAGAGWSFIWRFLPRPPALRSIDVRESGRNYSIVYEPAVGLDARNAPERITFESSQWHMEVTLDQTRSSPAFQHSTFTPAIPDGIRTIDLDEST
jgi:outer membrane biogenesis lipoprotein LolB